MIFNETRLKGAFIIDIEPHLDERGFFARTWCEDEFTAQGLSPCIKQTNISYNKKKGTLRGMHFQAEPHGEIKLVRCTKGEIFDVIIDIRPDSSTYMQYLSVNLSESNRTMLYIPKGFAHGFQTLTDDTEVYYQMAQSYVPGSERGIRWNDRAFDISWPQTTHRIMSERDQQYTDFIQKN